MNGIKHRTEGISGPKGLILALIANAEYDVLKGKGYIREDAKQFFRSDSYVTCLDFLGLPHDILPVRS